MAFVLAVLIRITTATKNLKLKQKWIININACFFLCISIPCSSLLQMRGNMAAETSCISHSHNPSSQRKASLSQFQFQNVQGRTVIGHAWVN